MNVKQFKQKLAEIEQRGKSKNWDSYFIIAFVSGSLGTLLFFAESVYLMWLPDLMLWIPCYLVGGFCLFFWLVFG